MGIFSLNRTSVGSTIEVQANESYVGVAGAYQAMADGYTNAYSVFENCIGLDMMEVSAERGIMESAEFEVVQENFLTDMFTKVRDFFKKLLEKIKGIVSTFVAKVKGSLCKDGKKLVDDYKKKVFSKDLSKFKYKWTDKDHADDKYAEGDGHIEGTLSSLVDKCEYHIKNIDKGVNGMPPDTEQINIGRGAAAPKVDKDDITDNTILEQALGKVIGTSSETLSDFSKEYHNYIYGTESEETGNKHINECMTILTGNKDLTKKLSDDEKVATKTCTDMIKKLESLQKTALNSVGDKNEAKSAYASDVNSILATTLQLANQYSSFVTKCYACKMESVKFDFAQARRVWVKAATYSPKTEAVLLAAVEEASDIQVESDFDAFMY